MTEILQALAFIIIPLGMGFLFFSKRSAEGLLKNTELKGQLVDLDKVRFQKEAERLLEEGRRKLMEDAAKSKKDAPVKPEDFN